MQQLLSTRCSDYENVVEEKILVLRDGAPMTALLARLRQLHGAARRDENLDVLRQILRSLQLLAALSRLVEVDESIPAAFPPRRRSGAGQATSWSIPWATAFALGAFATAGVAGALSGPRAPAFRGVRAAAPETFSPCLPGDPNCLPIPSHMPPLQRGHRGGEFGAACSAAEAGTSTGLTAPAGVERSLVAAGVSALASQNPVLALALAVAMPGIARALGGGGSTGAASSSPSPETAVAAESAAAGPTTASPLALLLMHLGLPLSSSAAIWGGEGGQVAPPEVATLAAAQEAHAQIEELYDCMLDAVALRRLALAAHIDGDRTTPDDAVDRGALVSKMHSIVALLYEHGVGAEDDEPPEDNKPPQRPAGSGRPALLNLLRPWPGAEDRGEDFWSFVFSPRPETVDRTKRRVAVAARAALGPPVVGGLAVPAWYVQSSACRVCYNAFGAAPDAMVAVVCEQGGSMQGAPAPRAVHCTRKHGLCVGCAAKVAARPQARVGGGGAPDVTQGPPVTSFLGDLLWGAVQSSPRSKPPALPPSVLLPGTPFSCPFCHVPGALQVLRFVDLVGGSS